MDILALLLLFALYVIPEVLRRKRKPQKYEYPQFPADAPTPPSIPARIQERKPQPFTAAPSVAASPGTEALAQPADADPVALSNLAYGLVMAEILGPPRSLNKLGWKRRF